MKAFINHNPQISFFIGLFGVLFAIYSYFDSINKNVHLAFYQYSTTDFFQKDKKIEPLSVFYKDIDLQKNDLNIKIFRIKLLNNGDTDISESFYDKNLPFGLRVMNGKFVGYTLVNSLGSDEYLTKNFNHEFKDSTSSDSIIFKKIIFDKGKYIFFDLMILHNVNVNPKLEALGKITGLDKLEVFLEKEKEKFTLKDFVYLVSIVALMFIALFLWIGIINFIYQVIDRITKFRRENYIKKLYQSEKSTTRTIKESLIKIYVKLGKKPFVSIMDALLNTNEIKQPYEESKRIIEAVDVCNKAIKQKKVKSKERNQLTLEYNIPFLIAVDILLDNKLIEEKDMKLKEDVKLEIEQILNLLKE